MKFRKHRLRLKKEIRDALTYGKTERFYEEIDGTPTETLVVKYRPGILPRFAIVVSRKVAKKSVWRNRIKRIVREALRELIREGKVPSYDMVIIIKRNIFTKKSYEVKAMLETIFEKCNTVKEKCNTVKDDQNSAISSEPL